MALPNRPGLWPRGSGWDRVETMMDLAEAKAALLAADRSPPFPSP